MVSIGSRDNRAFWLLAFKKLLDVQVKRNVELLGDRTATRIDVANAYKQATAVCGDELCVSSSNQTGAYDGQSDWFGLRCAHYSLNRVQRSRLIIGQVDYIRGNSGAVEFHEQAAAKLDDRASVGAFTHWVALARTQYLELDPAISASLAHD